MVRRLGLALRTLTESAAEMEDEEDAEAQPTGMTADEQGLSSQYPTVSLVSMVLTMSG